MSETGQENKAQTNNLLQDKNIQDKPGKAKIILLLTPTILSSLIIAAHFLRVNEIGLMICCLLSPLALIFRSQWIAKAIQMLLILASGIWILALKEIVELRMLTNSSWTTAGIILSAVILLAIASAFTYRSKALQLTFSKGTSSNVPAVAFIVVFISFIFVQLKVSPPALMVDRYWLGYGWIEVFLLSFYAGWIAEKFISSSKTILLRQRIWRFFSFIFFLQLVLGLSGLENFLMTGKLHIPIPAMIVAGPLFRADGFFMLILFSITIVITGPAWCSFFCYIGAWDDIGAKLKRKPQKLPSWLHHSRLISLAVVIIVTLILRAVGVSSVIATGLGVLFGLIGVLIMITYSRRKGQMVHCLSYCPIGWLAVILGKISPFRLRINNSCDDCNACFTVCRYNALNIDNIKARKPALSCTLCGDCLTKCPQKSIQYKFLGLNSENARSLFIVLVVVIHSLFLGMARI